MSITIPTRGVVDVTVRTRNKTMVSNGANAITPPGSFLERTRRNLLFCLRPAGT